MTSADPFYYLGNFETLLATLRERDGDLLDAQETRFMTEFPRLPRTARAILVRMAMRKGELFRTARLEYAEIGDVSAAVAPLIDLGWVDDTPLLTLDDLFALFTKPELVAMLAVPQALAAQAKTAMREALRNRFGVARPLALVRAGIRDSVLRLRIDAICERLRLLFFGNYRQTLAEFVLADLGVCQYETISLAARSRPFQTRAQVDAFFALHRCREMFRAGAAPADVERSLPPATADCEWLLERREKLRFEIGRAYERAGEWHRAYGIYSDCAYAEARPRAVRLHSKLRGFKPPVRAWARPRVSEFVLTIDTVNAADRVERCASARLSAAAGEPTDVHYVENTLVNSLLGLLCWPAIFAPLPGAFFHAFHRAPADLSSASFVARRAPWFAACLAELDAGTHATTIRARFAEKAGIASPFVTWGLFDGDLLDTALQCIPAAHLRCLFEWILRDVKANRAGFPDLVQFWPASRRYRLIEVKGPGDRLQANQRRCLDFCVASGIPVTVCHVRWAGDPPRSGRIPRHERRGAGLVRQNAADRAVGMPCGPEAGGREDQQRHAQRGRVGAVATGEPIAQ